MLIKSVDFYRVDFNAISRLAQPRFQPRNELPVRFPPNKLAASTAKQDQSYFYASQQSF